MSSSVMDKSTVAKKPGRKPRSEDSKKGRSPQEETDQPLTPSQRRREQNRTAQRNYREKQKKRIEWLEGLLKSQTETMGYPTPHQQSPILQPIPDMGHFPASIDSANNVVTYNMDFSIEPLAGMPWSAPMHHEPHPASNSRPSSWLNVQNDVPMVLAPTAYPIYVQSHGIVLDDSVSSNMSGSDLDMREPLGRMSPGQHSRSSELSGHSQGGSKFQICHLNETASSIPSEDNAPPKEMPIYHAPGFATKPITMQPMSFVTACTINAQHLCIPSIVLSAKKVPSPFHRGWVLEDKSGTAMLAMQREELAYIKEDLKPTQSQISQDHHAFIDVLPFPSLRDRLITLSNNKPPLLDLNELRRDMMLDGLICWVTPRQSFDIQQNQPSPSQQQQDSDHAYTAAPWDRRSWEAQPWFLDKWWILLGGKNGDVYQQTKWWRDMRGEPCFDPLRRDSS